MLRNDLGDDTILLRFVSRVSNLEVPPINMDTSASRRSRFALGADQSLREGRLIAYSFNRQ